MPVNDAAGEEVGLAESEPPGVVGTTGLAVVVVTAPLLVVGVVFDPAAVVGVAPPAAVVVVVLAPDLLVVVVVECLCVLSLVFLEADGVDDPHAAAIRPPARTTTPMAKVRPKRRSPLLVDLGESGVVCKVFLPHSSFVVLRTGPDPASATDIAAYGPINGPRRRCDS